MKTLTQIIKAHRRNDVASGTSGLYMFEEIYHQWDAPQSFTMHFPCTQAGVRTSAPLASPHNNDEEDVAVIVRDGSECKRR